MFESVRSRVTKAKVPTMSVRLARTTVGPAVESLAAGEEGCTVNIIGEIFEDELVMAVLNHTELGTVEPTNDGGLWASVPVKPSLLEQAERHYISGKLWNAKDVAEAQYSWVAEHVVDLDIDVTIAKDW